MTMNKDIIEYKKLRRKHKNSKNGCLDCKQRKIKCDENLPICTFCHKRNINCSYLTMTPYQINQIVICHRENDKRRKKKSLINSIDKESLSSISSSSSDKLDYEFDVNVNVDDEVDDGEYYDDYGNYDEEYIANGQGQVNNNHDSDFEDEDSDDTINYIKSKSFNNSSSSSSVLTVSPDNFQSPDYYHQTKEINLRTKGSTMDNVYHAHEMEGILLPESMGRNINFNNNTPKYLQLSTKFNHYNYNSTNNYNNNNNYNNSILDEGLFNNSKIVNKTFQLNRTKEFEYLDEFIEESELLHEAFHRHDFYSLLKKYGKDNIDIELVKVHWHVLSIETVFSKLLIKSSMLYSLDYYKNVILKQKILPLINYEIKLSISCKCENESVESINEITNIIKNDYITKYHEFLNARVSILLGGFLILNYCLAYHFKNGMKYDMNYLEGKKSVNLLGIFSTGLYSIIMERSRVELLLKKINILSLILLIDFKFLLVKNYSIDLIEDFKKFFEKHNNKFLNYIEYENLKIFLNKHIPLLRNNLTNGTLLNYNNGYLVRILNSFQSIIPYDFCNGNLNLKNNKIFENDEYKIIIYLMYSTIASILASTIPSITAFSSNGFYGTGWLMYNIEKSSYLMKIFNMIKSKELKIIAIYLIRLRIFLKNRYKIYEKYLKKLKIDKLFDSEISLEEKYDELIKLKFQDGGIMKEEMIKSFLLNKGQFFKKSNYPNVKVDYFSFNISLNNMKTIEENGKESGNGNGNGNGNDNDNDNGNGNGNDITNNNNNKGKNRIKVSANKINNYFKNEEEMIEDFTKSNNGLFSKDYKEFNIPSDSIAEEVVHIDGDEMKSLWKLLVYIRINNL
ncbi:hypothetical protein DAPK24_047260 [Pichia kluyveri]|uniref:Zn(2)-C6 fungal-type domain-containing protein n=1 Tax=Pichia kluyveri TaxID=36015 RepID=A0AAV5RA82_PICKL|nr:hypothetical protein DAPK24_047260 [Pichia kluyveri]